MINALIPEYEQSNNPPHPLRDDYADLPVGYRFMDYEVVDRVTVYIVNEVNGAGLYTYTDSQVAELLEG